MAVMYALHGTWPEVTKDKYLQENHCILATRTAIEVGRYFGVKLEPLPVSILLFNQPGWERFTQGIPVSDWPPEAWSVGTETNDEVTKTGWNGHLIISGGGMMLDLTANQMARSHRNIWAEPWILKTPDEEPPWVFRTDDDTTMILNPVEAKKYKGTKDWKVKHNQLAAESIRLIRPILVGQDEQWQD